MAKSILEKSGTSPKKYQGAFRTIAGRAYYAAYGYFCTRLLAAKGVTHNKMFGNSGRHGNIVTSLSYADPDLNCVQQGYSALLSKRVDADYYYQAGKELDRADAESAIDTAEDVISDLENASPQAYASFPLAPKN